MMLTKRALETRRGDPTVGPYARSQPHVLAEMYAVHSETKSCAGVRNVEGITLRSLNSREVHQELLLVGSLWAQTLLLSDVEAIEASVIEFFVARNRNASI